AAFLPSFLKSNNIKFGYISTWQSYEWALNGHGGGGPIQNLVKKQVNSKFVIKPHSQADIFFATSKFTREELMHVVGVDGNKVVICYLGVEPKFNNIPRSEPAKISNFIFFGRIVESKGIVDAIKALGMLTAKGFRDWNFRVVGQGNHEWARKLANEHGIGDKVVVCGPADDEQLENELKQAHLAIMPSHAESFGLAFAEAQAAGLPVVAYEAGSVPEVVENNVTGWLAPIGQVDSLAERIESAMRDPKGTYNAGLAGRERVKAMFTWEKTAKTILEGARAISVNGQLLI
ncbi:MAG: glycosyltransferase family 4 protein, partial [Calditrichaeota bacterium]|nr:glycosyltransferase family 4 protein [Calditrichota bacterium]